MNKDIDVLSVGQLTLDIPLRPFDMNKLASLEAVRVAPIHFTTGGDAGNVAANTACLGLRTVLISALGHDDAGEIICRKMAQFGVDCSHIHYEDAMSSSVSAALVEPNGQRRFIVNVEILDTIRPEYITQELLDRSKILFMGSAFRLRALDDGGIVPVFKKARESGIVTAFDTNCNLSSVPAMDRLREQLMYTDIFMPSWREAVEITGTEDLHTMREVISAFPVRWFIVKLGGRGCFATDFTNEYIINAIDVGPVVDTTGAGDSFASGILYAWATGKDIVQAAVFANCVAGHKVTHLGATGGVPSADVIEKYLKDNPDQIVIVKQK